MRFLGIFLIALFFSACATGNLAQNVEEKLTPALEINSVKIAKITFDELFFDIDISISNPLPLDIPLNDVAVNLYYQDKIISTNKIEGNANIKALLKSNLTLQSGIQIIDFVKLIADYRSLDLLPIKVEVLANIELPKALSNLDSSLEYYSLKERFELNIPTLHPQAELKDISLENGALSVVLNIKNRSYADFTLGDIAYEITSSDVRLNGIARSEKLSDGSENISFNIDLINLVNLKNIDVKNLGIRIDSSLKVEGFPYAIPINVDVK